MRPKYDISECPPDHTKIGEGIRLSIEEMMRLKEIEL